MSTFLREHYVQKFLLSEEEITLMEGVSKHDTEYFRRKHYQECYGMDTWYENLKEQTYATIVIDLKFEEAREILKYHQERNLKEWSAVLIGLEKKIEKSRIAHFKREMPFFIKLDTRSPKDVMYRMYDSEKVKKNVDFEFSKIKDKNTNDYNQLLYRYIKSMNKSMCCDNAREGVEMLIQSNRVFDDLTKQTSFGKPHFSSKVILRKWNDQLIDSPDFEFRAFCYKSKLTAITQYFTHYRSDFLHENKEEIKKSISDFFVKHIQESLRNSHGSYVIDFFVSKKGEVRVVEINPFHPDAGACLFSWQNPQDTKIILREGNGDTEFRIVEKKAGVEVLRIFGKRWEEYLEKVHGLTIFQTIRDEKKKKKEEQKKEESEKSSCVIL